MRVWLIDSPFQIFYDCHRNLRVSHQGTLRLRSRASGPLYAVPRAFRTHRVIAIFALLGARRTVGFISLLAAPWTTSGDAGTCIRPLPRSFSVLAQGLLAFDGGVDEFAALALIGVRISFLGAFYSYGV